RFGHRVVAQAQRDVLDLLDRMGKRRDARGVDRLHLLDEAKKLVELDKRVFGVGVGQFEPREMRDALNIGQGQSHAVTGKSGGPPQHKKERCDSELRRWRKTSKKGPAAAKSAVRFLQNIQNYKVSLRVRPKPGPTYQGL